MMWLWLVFYAYIIKQQYQINSNECGLYPIIFDSNWNKKMMEREPQMKNTLSISNWKTSI